MKNTNLGLTIAAFALGVTLLPASASAQVDTRRGGWSDRDRDRTDSSRNWDTRNRDWNRDDRRSDIEDLAFRTERESNAFRDWFERSYDARRLGRARDNRWLKHEIQELDESLERVRRRANDRRPENGRLAFEDAMRHAREIDRELIFENDRDTRFTTRPWVELRLTLDRLARAYGVRRF